MCKENETCYSDIHLLSCSGNDLNMFANVCYRSDNTGLINICMLSNSVPNTKSVGEVRC